MAKFRTNDLGGWNVGWHGTGDLTLGWHYEDGWDFGWYLGTKVVDAYVEGWVAGWSYGWNFGWVDVFVHDPIWVDEPGWKWWYDETDTWKYGWRDYGTWSYGWSYGWHLDPAQAYGQHW